MKYKKQPTKIIITVDKGSKTNRKIKKTTRFRQKPHSSCIKTQFCNSIINEWSWSENPTNDVRPF